jgi:hypothetical protein
VLFFLGFGVMIAAVAIVNEATKEISVSNGHLQTHKGKRQPISTLAASKQTGITIRELEGVNAALVAASVDQDTADTSRVLCGSLTRKNFLDAAANVHMSSQKGGAHYKALSGKLTLLCLRSCSNYRT